jgi:hypothetical protein
LSIPTAATVTFSDVTETNAVIGSNTVYTITATDPGATVTIS